jgi:hypothetical protein
MSTLSASSATPLAGALIDPTKQAEYPILLGDTLARKGSAKGSRFLNITYNHKSKSATSHQRATLTSKSDAPEAYDLVIKDKAGNAEQTTLTYAYQGTVDPSSSSVSPPDSELDTRNLVLIFDPKKKAFILEPVSTNLNFNLRSAPGKTTKQVAEQYPQLNILLEADHGGSGDDREKGSASDDEAALESNPYDYRHFLPKATADADQKSFISTRTTPEPHGAASKSNTPILQAAKENSLKPRSRVKTQSNPLRQVKRSPKPTTNSPGGLVKAKAQPKSSARVDAEDLASHSARLEADRSTKSNEATGGNTVNVNAADDLIIDFGSPPTRPKFHVNPTHFSSNNVSADEADESGDNEEEEIEDLRLPSPARQDNPADAKRTIEQTRNDPIDAFEEDDDALAAEMEAAFEESAREEEEARTQHYPPPTSNNQYIPSEDESEVSEEE